MYRATKPVRVVARSMIVPSKRGSLLYDFLRGFVDDLAVVRERGLGDDFVAPVELDLLFVEEQFDQVALVVRVQLAGMLADQARYVERRDDRDLADLNRPARLRVFA